MRHLLWLLTPLIVLVSCKPVNEAEDKQLVNGKIDLQNQNFDQSNIELGGDALFVWEKLINQDNSDSLTFEIIRMTNSWNNQPDGYKNYSAVGYASYAFKIEISEESIGKAFIIRPNHFIAYASQVFVNGEMVSNNGSVGASKTDLNYNPSRSSKCRPFVPRTNELEVIIWVANYSHFRGGIFNKFSFGLADNMIREREKKITTDLIVIVSLLLMFAYHLVMYFVNRTMKTGLFFGIACLVFAIDLSFQDTMTFFLLFPEASFNFTSKLHLIIPFQFPVSFMYFIYALYPHDVSRKIRNLTLLIAFSLTLITLFFPANVYMHLIKPNFAYALLVVVYVFVVAMKAVKNNRDGAWLFFVAYSIFSLCAVNDILYMFEVIHTANLVSMGLIIFVFLLSILQGRRAAIMHKNSVLLSNQLQELNISLEDKVKERTNELRLINDKLKDLLNFKESMTSTIIHDLKTPLNAIVNSELLSNSKERFDIIKQSGYSMLNLVENIIDVHRSDETQIKPAISKILLEEIIQSSKAEVEFSAKLKDLTINHSEVPSCSICVDKELIQRVLVNILSNAIKYSPENKEIDIKIELKNKDLRIAIINYGPSIPKDIQEHIFTMYGKGEMVSTEWHSSGLGLAFCKMAVEAHLGRIGVLSEQGKEVEFWLSLPNVVCNDTQHVITETRNTSVKISHNLLNEDIQFLKPFIAELKKLEVYEISSINQILRKINLPSEAINTWIEKIEKSTFSGDSDLFNKLLKM